MGDGKGSARGGPRSSPRPNLRADPRASGARAKRCVLVVDDVEDNRFLYTTYFSHVGFHAEQACDGEEALAKIARRAFDAVIMDLSMPKLDGWETTRRIKTNPATSHLLVIVVTGNPTEASVAAAHAAGADAVLTKPCALRDLLDRVRRGLDMRAHDARSPRARHER